MGGLGFCSMVEFNKALLAKQVWRIIQCPDYLMARILKAGYFKYEDIMQAKVGSNPSYIWRSIIWSRDLISKGLRWRVGDGQLVSAFKDSWIPGLHSGKSSTSHFDLADSKVVEFIRPYGIWDEERLRVSFPACGVEEILNIPVNPLG